MSTQGLFERISRQLQEIRQEKSAGFKHALEDPGGKTGPSSHPSARDDEHGQEVEEGARSAENAKDVKAMIPDSVDEAADDTRSDTPKDKDVQLVEGVTATATGEHPEVERDYNAKMKNHESGDKGKTTHPATATIGEKYSSISDAELYARLAELGNKVAADIANGFVVTPNASQTSFKRQSAAAARETKLAKAASAGAAAADYAFGLDEQTAAAVVSHVIKRASHQADLIGQYVLYETEQLRKQAEGDATLEELAAMVPPEDYAGGAPGDNGELDEETANALLAEMLARENGDAVGAPGTPEEAVAPGAELSVDDGIQELAMALLELGIDPVELAEAAGAGTPGEKLAALVYHHKRAGAFRISEAKTAQQRQLRDFMKGFVSEIRARSKK